METWVSIVLIILLAFAGMFLLRAMIRSGHFFKSFFISALSGIVCLIAVSFLKLGIVVNAVGLGVAALAGIPGVILLVGFGMLK